MQCEIAAFKAPLSTLDKDGQCWKHVREIQLMCTGKEDSTGNGGETIEGGGGIMMPIVVVLSIAVAGLAIYLKQNPHIEE